MTKYFKNLAVLLAALTVLAFTFTVGMIVYANRQTEAETVTVKINYYYYDADKPGNKGTRPYPAFVANMPKDSEPMVQRCPTVPGFSAQDIHHHSVLNVTVTFESSHEVDIFFVPSNVDYSIRLLLQTLDGSDYTLVNVLRDKGATGSIPKEFDTSYTFPQDYDGDMLLRGKSLSTAFEGYTLMYHQPDVIAADGSTEFECYYDRNYYHVDFVLGEGGQGTAPIYAPYEYPLSVERPTRAGFVFKGWAVQKDDPDYLYTAADVISLPKTITKDATYVAVWQQPEPIPYHIVYRNADLPDGSGVTKYSYWGKRTVSVAPSASLTVPLDDILAAYGGKYDELDEVNETTGRKELYDFPYFALDEAVTKEKNRDVIHINGDGSTVVTLYYARRVYEMKFVYARQPLNAQSYVNTTNAALNDSDGYVLLNRKSLKTLTDHARTQYGATGLQLAAMDVEPVRWFFEAVPDEPEHFYVYCFTENGSETVRRYLSIGNGTASLTEQPHQILVDRKTANSGYWTLSVPSDSAKNIYLNDKKDAGTLAAGSMYFATDEENSKNLSSQWLLSSAWGLEEYPGEVEISNTTANGLDPIKASQAENGWWGVKVKNLPTVTLPSSEYFSPGVSLTLQQERKSFEGRSYLYYYISLVAPYNADIESAWPAHAFSHCYRVRDNGEYRFGSWGTGGDSIYRDKYKSSDHSNIVGPYPTMSSEMTRKNKASDPVAQTLYAWWGNMCDTNSGVYAWISEHRMNIWLENVDDDDYTLFDPPDGRYTFECAHNGNTHLYPFVYKGFLVWPQDDKGVRSTVNREGTDGIYYTEFHYSRKRSALLFQNYNELYRTVPSVKYGTSLKEMEPPEPPCPSGLNSRYYTFQGWYTSDLFLPEEKVDWNTFTMPDHDEILYACWKPNMYVVNYYNDESDYRSHRSPVDAEQHSYGDYLSTEEIDKVQHLLKAPNYVLSDGTQEKAIPVGWYYYDEKGQMHAFDPDTMNVFGDLDLFMKWSTTVPAYYKVHYYLEGTTQKVASDTNGFSFVGLTKTFPSKTDKQLDPLYRVGYFPYYQSTSLLLKSDAACNEAIFYYVHLAEVPYRVRYVEWKDDGTEGKILHEDKLVLDNDKAVVTEKHLPIENYVPLHYYLTHTITVPDDDALDADGIAPENVITFYYREDRTHLPYRVEYLLEDDKGSEEMNVTVSGEEKTLPFKLANYIDSIGFRGEQETAVVNEYDGYEFVGWDEVVYFGDREHESSMSSGFQPCSGEPKPDSLSFCLDCTREMIFSKEVHLLYVKKTYPVKVSYSLASDDLTAVEEWCRLMQEHYPDLQPDPSTQIGNGVYKTLYRIDENQRFGDSYTAYAEELDKYRLSGQAEQTIVIAHDEVFAKNRISFVYTEVDQIMFHYVALIPKGADVIEAPDESGLLNVNEECVALGELPVMPVTAKKDPEERITLSDNVTVPPYRFVGWYEDWACTKPVKEEHPDFLSENGTVLLPNITPTIDHTFYARYDYLYGDLTITTEGCLTEPINLVQCFEYRVQGIDTTNHWVDLRVLIQGNGSQTVTRLPVGHYTVTQTNWSWRYTSDQPNNQITVLVLDTDPAAADFHQTMTNPKWLDGNERTDTKPSPTG